MHRTIPRLIRKYRSPTQGTFLDPLLQTLTASQWSLERRSEARATLTALRSLITLRRRTKTWRPSKLEGRLSHLLADQSPSTVTIEVPKRAIAKLRPRSWLHLPSNCLESSRNSRTSSLASTRRASMPILRDVKRVREYLDHDSSRQTEFVERYFSRKLKARSCQPSQWETSRKAINLGSTSETSPLGPVSH